MEKKFIKITDKNEWQGLLDKVLFGTFFHFCEWEEFLESQFKWLKFERYLWPRLAGQALLSLARIKIGRKEKLVSHPFCEYGGPLPLVEKIDGRAFQKDIFAEFKGPLKIGFHPKLLDYFEGMEFPENQRETYLFENLNTQNITQLWDKLDRNRHRAIKSAEAQGFEIKKCESPEALKKIYSFYIESLKKHRAPVYPFSFFEFFLKNSKAEILLAEKGGKLIGGNIFLFYGGIVHSFLCGFEEKYRKLGAHSFVLWEMLKRAMGSGYQTFDFGGTRSDSSIKEFKERWGAKPYPIFELKNYREDSSLRQSRLRNVYGLLPAFLIKRISPYLLKYKL